MFPCLLFTLLNYPGNLTTGYNFLVQYEDPVRQEAARKTVPIEDLEEKALVSLAKVRAHAYAGI